MAARRLAASIRSGKERAAGASRLLLRPRVAYSSWTERGEGEGGRQQGSEAVRLRKQASGNLIAGIADTGHACRPKQPAARATPATAPAHAQPSTHLEVQVS